MTFQGEAATNYDSRLYHGETLARCHPSPQANKLPNISFPGKSSLLADKEIYQLRYSDIMKNCVTSIGKP